MRRELERWIASRFSGWRVEALAGDASTRRFYRIAGSGGQSRVVMDYGVPFSGTTDDQALTAVFLKAGLPVAEIVAASPEVGCLVLEDLGRRMLEDELGGVEDQGEPPELLLRAAELAGRIAKDGTTALARSDRAAGPVLDAERFCFEMDFFVDNFVGGYRKITGDQGELRGLLHDLAGAAAQTPAPVLCHRDYHSRNIMVTERGALALVDLQDARWGPDTYDLASLAFDAYLERPDAWVEPLAARYLATAGIDDGTLVRARLHQVAAQRMIKALGTFGYQIEVAGNQRYSDAIPRTLSRLDRCLRQSETTSPIHASFAALGLFETPP